jgi:alcohol dehydrogenase/propanol-preferring alcohol dehydrogenase
LAVIGQSLSQRLAFWLLILMVEQMDVWALTEWDTPLQKLRQDIPTPQGTEVVVKVTHAGVCHSDLHFAEGFYELGGGKRFYVKDRTSNFRLET